jgi:hypothetical protein
MLGVRARRWRPGYRPAFAERMRHRGIRGMLVSSKGAWPQLRILASIHCPIQGSKSTRHSAVTLGRPNIQKREIDKEADGAPPVSSVECLLLGKEGHAGRSANHPRPPYDGLRTMSAIWTPGNTAQRPTWARSGHSFVRANLQVRLHAARTKMGNFLRHQGSAGALNFWKSLELCRTVRVGFHRP